MRSFTRGVHMVSGLQLNVFKMFFLSWKKFLFSFPPPGSSLPERRRGGGRTLNGFAAGLGWQQSGQRVVGLWLPPTKRPSNKKLRAKIKPHLAPLFAKIITNRFRLINKQKKLESEVVKEVLIRSRYHLLWSLLSALLNIVKSLFVPSLLRYLLFPQQLGVYVCLYLA